MRGPTPAVLQDNFTSFVPHFMHRRCMESPERCAASCINNGRYCAFDSIVDAFAGTFQPRQARNLALAADSSALEIAALEMA